MTMTRRGLLAAGATLAALLSRGKPAAAVGSLEKLSAPLPAPDAPFYTADGKKETLSDFRGKPVLVNLWATWCAPCVAELPSLAKLAAAIRPDGFVVLPVSSDHGGAPRVEAFFKDHGISGLPVLIDRDAALTHAFKARGLPSSYVLNPAGLIVAKEEGGMDWAVPGVAEELRRLVGTVPA